jgi:hypothetical protein
VRKEIIKERQAAAASGEALQQPDIPLKGSLDIKVCYLPDPYIL